MGESKDALDKKASSPMLLFENLPSHPSAAKEQEKGGDSVVSYARPLQGYAAGGGGSLSSAREGAKTWYPGTSAPSLGSYSND
eukprot:1323943-Rhodomonas_salina.1